MKSCCGNVSKWLLNLLGLIIAILGFWIGVAYPPNEEFSTYVYVLAIVFFILDAATWWATVTENRCCLIASAVLESILLVSIIVLLILNNKESGRRESSQTDLTNKIMGVAVGVEIIRIGLESFIASVIRAER